jgi:hypothetical protein
MANIIGNLPVTLQNGTTADASQVMSDLNFIVNQVNANAFPSASHAPGTLLSIQIFSTAGAATYTPNTNATKALVKGCGGGGGGAGSLATGSTTVSIGTGGASGSPFEHYISSGLTSLTLNIGAAGTGGSGANGTSGGNTTIGSPVSITAPGGNGGQVGIAATAPYVNIPGTPGGVSTGANIWNGNGSVGSIAAAGTGTGDAVSGSGGNSVFGGGAPAVVANNNGVAATSPGAGGSGAATSGTGGPDTGGNGGVGILIFYEYA